MKKLLAFVLALLLLLSLLVACAPDDNTDDPPITDGSGNDEPLLPDDGSDPAMPDVEWSHDLPLA